jgi:hypothetical protein
MVKRQSLAQLFREIHKIEAQVVLLRLDLQAAGILPKTTTTIDYPILIPGQRMVCGGFVPDADGPYQVDSCVYCGRPGREHSQADAAAK